VVFGAWDKIVLEKTVSSRGEHSSSLRREKRRDKMTTQPKLLPESPSEKVETCCCLASIPKQPLSVTPLPSTRLLAADAVASPGHSDSMTGDSTAHSPSIVGERNDGYHDVPMMLDFFVATQPFWVSLDPRGIEHLQVARRVVRSPIADSERKRQRRIYSQGRMQLFRIVKGDTKT